MQTFLSILIAVFTILHLFVDGAVIDHGIFSVMIDDDTSSRARTHNPIPTVSDFSGWEPQGTSPSSSPTSTLNGAAVTSSNPANALNGTSALPSLIANSQDGSIRSSVNESAIKNLSGITASNDPSASNILAAIRSANGAAEPQSIRPAIGAAADPQSMRYANGAADVHPKPAVSNASPKRGYLDSQSNRQVDKRPKAISIIEEDLLIVPVANGIDAVAYKVQAGDSYGHGYHGGVEGLRVVPGSKPVQPVQQPAMNPDSWLKFQPNVAGLTGNNGAEYMPQIPSTSYNSQFQQHHIPVKGIQGNLPFSHPEVPTSDILQQSQMLAGYNDQGALLRQQQMTTGVQGQGALFPQQQITAGIQGQVVLQQQMATGNSGQEFLPHQQMPVGDNGQGLFLQQPQLLPISNNDQDMFQRQPWNSAEDQGSTPFGQPQSSAGINSGFDSKPESFSTGNNGFRNPEAIDATSWVQKPSHQGSGQFDDTSLDRSAGQGTGQGIGQGTGQGIEQGTGQGIGQGTGQGIGQGTGQGIGQGTGQRIGQGTGQGIGQGTGQGIGQGTGQGIGQGTGQGIGQDHDGRPFGPTRPWESAQGRHFVRIRDNGITHDTNEHQQKREGRAPQPHNDHHQEGNGNSAHHHNDENRGEHKRQKRQPIRKHAEEWRCLETYISAGVETDKLVCPPGLMLTSFGLATLGNPQGTCSSQGTRAPGSCHLDLSTKLQERCLGKSVCDIESIPAAEIQRNCPDYSGTSRVVVEYKCSPWVSSPTTTNSTVEHCQQVQNNGTLSCPQGQAIVGFGFGYFGEIDGSCSKGISPGICSRNVMTDLTMKCVGRSQCQVEVNAKQFGSACSNNTAALTLAASFKCGSLADYVPNNSSKSVSNQTQTHAYTSTNLQFTKGNGASKPFFIGSFIALTIVPFLI